MTRLEIISEKITNSIGTPTSIVVHTILFLGIFMLKLVGFGIDQILLVLTTAVSLEAIYLAIFIQMSVNKTSKSLASVEKDIDEIQEDVDDIQEDVDDIQEDVEDLGSDEENEMIKTIKDIEKRLTLLHKEIVDISNKKN
jgi:low affinity Fe/Cu permease